MKIVAIGSTLLDIEIGCSNTLQKFVKLGHSVSLVIPRDKHWKENQKIEQDDIGTKLKISNIYRVENFDYSKITQLNVNLIKSLIGRIKPSVAIIPFINNSDKMKKILAKSAILACRNVETILMYENSKNSNFLPNVYLVTNNKRPHYLQKIYANKLGISQPVEAFESQRLILLQNDLF